MLTRDIARDQILETLNTILAGKDVSVEEHSPLIGPAGIVDSMDLVELCVKLEDKAYTLGFEFDWTSESAMSKSTSMFRSVANLIDEFFYQSTLEK